MRLHSLMLIVLLGAAVVPAVALPAHAECAEGMTVSGECIDPGLAAAARQQALILSQPKISYTAFPVLPNDDRSYRYPNQLNPDPQGSSSFVPTPGHVSFFGRLRN